MKHLWQAWRHRDGHCFYTTLTVAPADYGFWAGATKLPYALRVRVR